VVIEMTDWVFLWMLIGASTNGCESGHGQRSRSIVNSLSGCTRYGGLLVGNVAYIDHVCHGFSAYVCG
jgi:hypothetical protein